MTADGRLTGGRAAPPQPTGYERYGRYYLIERIGRGGMAEVFRAVAHGVEGFRRVFVIKRIRPEKSESRELVRMFCDEARLSALLHHPNVVQVYDFGQISGTYFLAMEYLRGKDLAAVMRVVRRAKSALEPSIAAHVAQQVATGLHYAHAMTGMDGQLLRVVHRDVTPSNIMLQRTGAVKVLDFGIAQATNFARQVETGGGRVKGKLAYLSPEQVRLQELDGRSDIFALGIVLWEMLVGQRLFPGENDFLTMRNVLNQVVPAPSSLRPQVPPALDAIVARALERDREQRYPSAQAMADDLERFLRQAPCASQAMPRLLHELFGEESTDQTPEIPDLGDADSLHASSPASMSGPPTPTPSDEAMKEAAKDAAEDAVFEIEIEALPHDASPDAPSLRSSSSSHPSSLSSRALADPSRARRRIVAAAAATTLAGCLLWAVSHGKHPAEPSPASRTLAAGAPVIADRTPPSPTAPRASPPAVESPAPADFTPAPALVTAPAPAPLSATAPARPAARKRVTSRISNDVTLDPFK